jgi:hypothetical protein
MAHAPVSESAEAASKAATDKNPDWIALVREKVEGLRFGVVQLVVHDGRVTQIERTEKTRLPAGRDGQPQA